MTIAIHQPHFLPWLGYFNKVWHSETFVWLNSVQYRRRYYQNRAKIKINEQPSWLTLPVQAEYDARIDEVLLAGAEWRKSLPKTIEYTYKRAPYFNQCGPPLFDALTRAADTLDDVNYQTFITLMNLLRGDHVRVVRANELALDATDPTGRLVEICVALGANRYIAGRGGGNYMDVAQFAQAGIEIVWQDFDFNGVEYPQMGKTFVPGLSLIDCLFNIGPEATRELVSTAWAP